MYWGGGKCHPTVTENGCCPETATPHSSFSSWCDFPVSAQQSHRTFHFSVYRFLSGPDTADPDTDKGRAQQRAPGWVYGTQSSAFSLSLRVLKAFIFICDILLPRCNLESHLFVYFRSVYFFRKVDSEWHC